jgi:hypothetical protein
VGSLRNRQGLTTGLAYLRLEAGCADPFSDSHARLCLFCLTEEESLPGSPYYRVYYEPLTDHIFVLTSIISPLRARQVARLGLRVAGWRSCIATT